MREGIEFRHFPESTVAYHPDSGDILVLDASCGRILQAMADAGGVLGHDEIAARAGEYGLKDVDQVLLRLDELEFRDLLRMIGPA